MCRRIEIAGSVRRRKNEDIKDVEVVAIPDNSKLSDLRDRVNGGLAGRVVMGPFPSKYTKLSTAICNIDIFWVTPESWGLQMLIRTGPAGFSARVLTYWKKITDGGFSNGGILHLSDSTIVPTPEEQDVFDALERFGGKPCKFIPPEKRTER